MLLMYKRGQIAIWVILALVIVVSIGALFLFKQGPTSNVGKDVDVNSYIEKCAREYIDEAVDKLVPQGGFIEPQNFILYNDIKVEYLCENVGHYKPCINQHPMLVNEIRTEIKEYITPRIDQCFSELKTELESKNYDVNMGIMSLDVNLIPDRVLIDLNREFNVDKDGATQRFEEFRIDSTNPIYNLADVAIEIANQEAKYCYFEYVGYMLLYPRIDVKKTSLSDSTKIYTITDNKSKKEMNIAIRSCAIPPGI